MSKRKRAYFIKYFFNGKYGVVQFCPSKTDEPVDKQFEERNPGVKITSVVGPYFVMRKHKYPRLHNIVVSVSRLIRRLRGDYIVTLLD